MASYDLRGNNPASPGLRRAGRKTNPTAPILRTFGTTAWQAFRLALLAQDRQVLNRFLHSLRSVGMTRPTGDRAKREGLDSRASLAVTRLRRISAAPQQAREWKKEINSDRGAAVKVQVRYLQERSNQ